MPGILCSAVGDRILLSWCLQPHELKREVDSTIFKTNRRCDKLICTCFEEKSVLPIQRNLGLQMHLKEKNI